MITAVAMEIPDTNNVDNERNIWWMQLFDIFMEK